MKTWLSLLCPSCRPHDLKKWLDSLYVNCVDPKSIELSLTLEQPYEDRRWGNVIVTMVTHGQYNINQLTEICYKQSTSPYIFLSGDDTICESPNWDRTFKILLDQYPDNVVLLYPNDTIFGKDLACYPVTSRLVMDSMNWPVPFERYAIDDTIFDIVPYSRRIYLENVVMRHLHLVKEPPGHPIMRDGILWYYPHDVEAMNKDRSLFIKLQGERDAIRGRLQSMINNKKSKILIGVPTAEMARRADFYDYFNMLDKPEGTAIAAAHGQSPARNRNLIIQQALKADCTHVFFLDDDLAFKPDILTRLLAHDVDIVGGYYLLRNYPHKPIVFDYTNEEGRCRHFYPQDDQTGLHEVVALGLGAVLIKTDVFKAMTKESKDNTWIRLGELEKDHWCDDIGFWKRVREYGFKLYCDLDVMIGHMAQVTIWPDRLNDKWMVAYDTNSEDGRVAFQSIKPVIVAEPELVNG